MNRKATGMGKNNKDYKWELIDDGTLDTVIRITLKRDSDIGKKREVHELRFSSEYVRDEFTEGGALKTDLIDDEVEMWAEGRVLGSDWI